MTLLPIFPLGSVLLPGMPISLRIFEPRFQVMLSRALEGSGEFGVVLIERGSEVGGGDQRFPAGTVARITSCDLQEGWINVVALGGRRFAVEEWLADDPHPQASVRLLPPLTWSEALGSQRNHAERIVRRALARASEYRNQRWPSDVELADDPVMSAWQLAGIAPLGPLDQLTLLRSESMGELLDRLVGLTEAAAETMAMSDLDDFGLAGGLGGDDPEDR